MKLKLPGQCYIALVSQFKYGDKFGYKRSEPDLFVIAVGGSFDFLVRNIMILGIDPGWASFGVAIESEGKTIFKASYVPRDHNDDIFTFMVFLNREIHKGYVDLATVDKKESWYFTDVYIERFVAYKGIHSDMSEKILMLIGALNYEFTRRGSNVHMVRAIDWKPKICKYLVRTKDFNNPNPSFDKKFSIAAANALSGGDSKVDHEADAICLSYLGLVDIFNEGKNMKK